MNDDLDPDALVERLRAKTDWPCVRVHVRKLTACSITEPPNEWCDLCAMRFAADFIDELVSVAAGLAEAWGGRVRSFADIERKRP